MKKACAIICIILNLSVLAFSQTGASCSSPYVLILDSVYRNYTTSPSTGNSLVCTYPGSSVITFFNFTTNSSAERIILDITAPGGQPCEVAMYNGTSCNGGSLNTGSSMCFDDGTGLWAVSETFSLAPNTTYALRIKTAVSGTLTIGAYNYTPPNDNCAGSFQLSPIAIQDNNANHTPGPGVISSQLCASTLENTAFYTYTVDIRGKTTFSIESISCDNGSNNASNGFQIGFFTGTCSSLSYFKCYAGLGPDIQVQTDTLDAGTQVYVAVDGVQGSNCRFWVRAQNAIVLPASLKFFIAGKHFEENILRWVSLREFENDHYEIQRSSDGVNFRSIGRVPGQMNSNNEKTYQFIDHSPVKRSFYRLAMVSASSRILYSKIVEINRDNESVPRVVFGNIVKDQLNLHLYNFIEKKINGRVVDNTGRTLIQMDMKVTSGDDRYNVNTSSFAPGLYYLIISGPDFRKSYPFIKS